MSSIAFATVVMPPPVDSGVLLAIPSNPIVFTAGQWPPEISTSRWSVVVVPTVGSASAPSNFERILRLLADSNSGFQFFEEFLSLCSPAGAFEPVNPSLSWSALQPLTLIVDWVARLMAVRNATTGNLILPIPNSWVWPTSGSLSVGEASAGVEVYDGTINDFLRIPVVLPVASNPTSFSSGTWSSDVSLGKFTFSIRPNYASASATPDLRPLLFFGADNTSKFAFFEEYLAIYSPTDVFDPNIQMQWDALQLLTFTIDWPGRTLTIEGANVGDGTYAIPGSWNWPTTGTLYVGESAPATDVFDGTIYDLVVWPT